MDVSPKSLKNFGHDDASEGERFDFINHPPQFAARAAGRQAEKLNPDGSVNQNQERFRRIRLWSPFQTPLP